MKKLFLFSTLLFVSILTISGVAFGWGSGGGDGSYYGQLQELAVFYNNSGVRLVHGMAVILDTSGTAGSTLGAYVTGATASADSDYCVGVVKTAADASMPVTVVTRGAIDTLVQDSSEAISAGSEVGTAGTGTIGCVGAGSNLGVALENGDGTDGSYLYIWVNPSSTD
jgi:hypothetical protein